MYGNPMMTDDEKQRMMAAMLAGRDAARMRSPTGTMMANAEQDMMNDPYNGPSNADRTTGVPMPDDMNPSLLNEQPYTPPVERISPMGSPMTPQEIDEEIMRLQMLKQTMGT
tara:strand:- start:4187 stop:4522 length:336 start_codon:yes stop_codon:yes gene_type:complete